LTDSDEQNLAAQIKSKTLKGASALFFRQIFVMVINFCGSIVLARVLTPSDFGVYVIVAFILNCLMLFTDVGLGAALIRAKEDPTEKEYQSIFSVQLVIVISVVSVIFIAAPFISAYYNAEENLTSFLRFMTATLLLSPLGSISAIKLERKLEYGVFARIESMSMVADKAVAVILALNGFGYWSFGVAAFVNSLVRISTLYRAAPWRIGWRLDIPFLKSVIKFGGYFQLASLTSLFRDNINAILIGPIFGTRSMGYLNWAHNVALQGSQIFTSIVSRVNFPSLSRVQDQPAVLSEIVNKSLRALNVLTMPILFVACVLIHEIVDVVYTAKWTEAIPAFYFYATGMIFGNITTTLSGLLLAVGEAKKNFVLLLVWTIMVWLFSAVFIDLFGYIGLPAAVMTAAVLISAWFIFASRKYVILHFYRVFVSPLIGALSGAFLVYWLKSLIKVGLLELVLLGLLGGGTSLALNVIFDTDLRQDIASLLSKFLERYVHKNA